MLGAYVTRAQELPPGVPSGYVPRSELAISAQMLSMRLATRWPIRVLLEKQFGSLKK